MNSIIKRKLMEIERFLTSIEQWYKYITDLNRYQRNVIRQECGQTLGRVRVRTDIGQQ